MRALVAIALALAAASAEAATFSGGGIGAVGGVGGGSASCPSPSGNISIALNAHRVSGPAPLVVNFSTQGTTNSLGYHYRELTYTWDFDDPGSGNWRDGRSRNFEGFKAIVAAHMWETPGTYDPVLTVFAPDGTCNTSTVAITVQNPDTVYAGALTACIANSTATAGVGGCPSGADTPAGTTDGDAALANCAAAGERCLFKRGDTFTFSTVRTFSADDIMVSAYGSGADPIFTDAGAFPSEQYIGCTGADQLHVSEIDVQIATAGRDFVGRTTSPNNVCHNLTIANVNGAGGQLLRMDTAQNDVDGVSRGVATVANTWASCDGGTGDYCIWAKAKRVSHLGNDLDMQQNGEHVLRSGLMVEGVVAHNLFTGAASTKSEVKLHAVEAADGAAFAERDSEWIYFAWNDLENTAGNPVVAVGPQDVSSDEWVHDFIGESNYCDAGASAQICFKMQVSGETLMANTVCDTTGMTAAHECITYEKSGSMPSNTPTDLYAWGTTSFDDDAGVNSEGVSFKMGANPRECTNSLMIGDGTLDPCLPNGATEVSSQSSSTRPFETSPPTARAHFKITAGSAPDDAGTCIDGLEYDFEGDKRPQGAGCDIGADEDE